MRVKENSIDIALIRKIFICIHEYVYDECVCMCEDGGKRQHTYHELSDERMNETDLTNIFLFYFIGSMRNKYFESTSKTSL